MLKICRLEESVLLHMRNSRLYRRELSAKSGNVKDSVTGRYSWQRPCGQHTDISIYNHSMGGKVPLVLSNPQMVTWYTCGPTVYDSTHLGHASTYVKVDIIQRILRDYFKYNLVTAMNITDVDDKIIKRSRESGRNWEEMTRNFDSEFVRDMQLLNVKPPNLRAHVSANIPAIQRFIEQLLSDDKAYVTEDKSVYFDVSACENYGKLQKISTDEPKEQPKHKRNAADFALWKAKKAADEPSWQSSWGGDGRPGWHIECSAIAGMFFGNKLDFHAGGLDLRFPHHENEEAQCCAHYKTKQWVNYWLHTGQLFVSGEQQKMSKSLGNTISLSEFLKHYTADEFRMACLLSNYRNPMQYSDQMMQTARQTLRKFINFNADLNAYMQFQKPLKYLDEGALEAQLKHMVTEFDNSLRDDFDTARAVSVLIDQMSSISRCINDQQADAEQQPAHCLNLLLAVGNFVTASMHNLGIKHLGTADAQKEAQATTALNGVDLDVLVADILQIRGKLREEAVKGGVKNLELLRMCDQLRNILVRHGIEVRDHKQGSSWVYGDKSKSISHSG
ncbi:probable cysteine--tRNA ligase, mitochondrial [Drosophila albomicans]|uniref:cysteine--tRNA ligase n=1 Tax=Drosophila albomicans TaxID=7291 RepID=A0A6P8X3D7_DROAB|nr:probable cysteine--tRNA ligase, mitochondrial [Drosophila albomicans]